MQATGGQSGANLDLGVIGNGAIAALIDVSGSIVWQCMPRFDGDPIYNSLLGGPGQFCIALEGQQSSRREYVRNTAILTTVIEAEHAAIEIIDFMPRFERRGRTFQPMAHVRRVRPLRGAPRVKVTLRPTSNWGKEPLAAHRGTSHIRFSCEDMLFRVTTDAPITYVMKETPFILNREINFVTGVDEVLSDSPANIARTWQESTAAYWHGFVLRLGLPLEWQDAVIRAAITLKMCVYEETGGIVAALTTSIPEHADSSRNWDYRFCWLRDAYFTVSALNRLSAIGTMEGYLHFLSNIAAKHATGLQPVFGVGLETELDERIIDWLPGYRNHRPVRSGNQAGRMHQHDAYGHVVLASTQAFFDSRLERPFAEPEFKSLERMGEQAYALFSTPDAGIWEYRTKSRVHSSSALLCWAACDRLSKIAHHLRLSERASYWRQRSDAIARYILEETWSERRRSFVAGPGTDALDASILLMAEVGFLAATDPRFVASVGAIGRELQRDKHIFRYIEADDFGEARTAFIACTFWYVDALARIGRTEEAIEIFQNLINSRNSLGMLSEDIDALTGELWGNFPQTYSMVGIINAAAGLSRPWRDIV